MILTKENSYVLHLFYNYVEHLIGDVLNLVSLLLLLQPFEHLLFVLEITLIYHRNALLEVEHRRYFLNAILLSLLRVVNLHERHAELIALIVDVLQFIENFLRLPIVIVVCVIVINTF